MSQPTLSTHLTPYQTQLQQLREVGRQFYQRGWSVGTSSNYSQVVERDPLKILITASGKDKGNLSADDFVCVDGMANPTGPGQPKSSAETWLHVAIADLDSTVGSVLHTHSVWGTVLSDLYAEQQGFWIEGYEMLKGLEGNSTHQHKEWIPIYENTQDIATLADRIRADWAKPDRPAIHGFLMRNHGLYTWGKDVFSARRHIEVFEFLFECLGRRRMLA